MTVVSLTDRQRKSRTQDNAYHRHQLEIAASETDAVYQSIKDRIVELRNDGGHDAVVESLCLALWRLKQAETEIEKAKGKVGT